MWGHSTLHNIHMDTNMPHFIISICYGYRVWVYMECGNTPHFVISIWIQTWIWIQSMDLHGVWRHFTLINIHMDTHMAPCLHIITVAYFRYQNRSFLSRHHIINHNSRILNIHPQCCQEKVLSR